MTAVGAGLATAVALGVAPLGALPAVPAMAARAPAVLHPAPLLLVVWLGVVTCGAAYWCFMHGIQAPPPPPPAP